MELQGGLGRLSDWSEDWLLSFNANKCKRVHMGYDNPKHQYHMRTPMGQVILEETCEERDLGVWLNNNMKPSLQCTKAATKAMSELAVTRKSLSFFDCESFKIVAYIEYT